jgi:hypothetical protein
MEMERKNIYGTNNSQVMYTFRIIEETETHYKTYDVDYPQWKLNFEKDTLKCTSDDKIVEKVVNEGLFVSFDLDEVKKEYLNRSIAISENSLSKYLKEYNDFKEYLEKVYNNDFSYKTYSNVDLNKLEFKQRVIFVLENNKMIEGVVSGFLTTDKTHFKPIFEYVDNGDDIISSHKMRKDDEGYYVITFESYDYNWEEEVESDAKVFFNYDDYYNYAYNIQLEKDISKLNGYKNKVKETERNIQKMKNQL